MKNFCKDPFFLESTCACVLGPWPRECLSSKRLSLALASDFFCVLGLGLESCVLDSTSAYLPIIALRPGTLRSFSGACLISHFLSLSGPRNCPIKCVDSFYLEFCSYKLCIDCTKLNTLIFKPEKEKKLKKEIIK